MRVFGDAQIRAQRQPEHAAAEPLRARTEKLIRPRTAICLLSGTSVPATICMSVDFPRRCGRRDDFAGADAKIDAAERTDGAEMLFDAVQFDDSWARNDHCPYTWRQRAVVRFDEATTSCWL